MNGAHFIAKSSNHKLSPVIAHPAKNPTGMYCVSPRPVAPFCAVTYVSINATCDDVCPFKKGGCYVRSGFTGKLARRLDEETEKSQASDVIFAEVQAIREGANRLKKESRDLRLHVSGDARNAWDAIVLDEAAHYWKSKGGGSVWTYTHAWRHIERMKFGTISVLASVENAADFKTARDKGYTPAIVVDRFRSKRAWKWNGWRVIPCPAETGKVTCVECRLCLNADKLFARKAVIAFEAHNCRDKNDTRRALKVLQ